MKKGFVINSSPWAWYEGRFYPARQAERLGAEKMRATWEFKMKSIHCVLALVIIVVAVIPMSHAEDKVSSDVEIVHQFDANVPPGNIAVTPDGRIIMSLHQFYGSKFRVVEVKPDGTVVPFPTEKWSQRPEPGSDVGLNTVLGLRCDNQGIVWMLDRTPTSGFTGKVVGWNSTKNILHRIIYLGRPIVSENAFLNDLAVDSEHSAIYITDTASGHDSALIVINLKTGQARRVLQGHLSTRPEDIPMVIDGRRITLGDEEARVGVNPITVDPQNEWVYFGPMSGHNLYRIRTADLLDFSIDQAALAGRVQRYGEKPICDGITVDGKGNVYITEIAAHAIGVVGRDGKYRRLFQDEKHLSWPDGMGFSPDNFIYVTVNQLHRSPPLNNGENSAKPPFYIVRFKSLAAGKQGR
jgi:sugar lactone lactonase YvrE